MSGPCDRLDGCPALGQITDLLERQQAAREALEAFRTTVVAERDALRVEVARQRAAAFLGYILAIVSVVALATVRYWGLS
jgi:hypothetical protein